MVHEYTNDITNYYSNCTSFEVVRELYELAWDIRMKILVISGIK